MKRVRKYSTSVLSLVIGAVITKLLDSWNWLIIFALIAVIAYLVALFWNKIIGLFHDKELEERVRQLEADVKSLKFLQEHQGGIFTVGEDGEINEK